MADLGPMSPDEEQELAQALDRITECVGMLSASLVETRRNLALAASAIGVALENNRGEIEAATAEMTRLAGEATKAAETIELAGQAAVAVIDEIDLLLDAADDVISPVLDLPDAIAEAANEAYDNTREFVEGWMARHRELLDEAVVDVGKELRETIAEPIVEVVDAVFEDLSNMAAGLVRETLQPLSDELAQAVDGLIDEIVDRLVEGDEETRQENLALRPIVDALRPPVDALIDQVERVTPLAQMVGMG